MRGQPTATQGTQEAPLSLFARLELAMARHAALDEDASARSSSDKSDPSASVVEPAKKATSLASPSSLPQQLGHDPEDGDLAPVQTITRSPTNSVAALADQLQTLLQSKNRSRGTQDEDDEGVDDAEEHPTARRTLALQKALAKIGSDEKDDLLVHLLHQVASYRAQLSEVATLGETIAAQLVRQQHELRVKHREQLESLEHELHDAVHAHPRVVALEERVDDLEEQNREKDQQLRFAVQKLQRSRQREKELKMMHDPLWVV